MRIINFNVSRCGYQTRAKTIQGNDLREGKGGNYSTIHFNSVHVRNNMCQLCNYIVYITTRSNVIIIMSEIEDITDMEFEELLEYVGLGELNIHEVKSHTLTCRTYFRSCWSLSQPTVFVSSTKYIRC